MKYELMVRSRAKQDESIPSKHAAFFLELSKISAPWGIDGHAPPPAPDPGVALGAGAPFSKMLGKGIKARVYYVFRREFKDLGMHDDFFDMSFNPMQAPYKQLLYEVLPRYILGFDAYYAHVGDSEFGYLDFDAERQAGFGDTRFGVYRVYPVMYCDAVLCDRSFGRTPKEIIARLQGRVEHATLIKDGVYIIATSEPLELERANKLSWEVKKAITD
jgi:hypothetical protein